MPSAPRYSKMNRTIVTQLERKKSENVGVGWPAPAPHPFFRSHETLLSHMKTAYRTEPFPKMRRLAPNIGRLSHSRYTILGLLEIDVTLPRKVICEYESKSGEKLPFTAFLAECVGRAVSADPGIQAMRNWKGDLVIYSLSEACQKPGM